MRPMLNDLIATLRVSLERLERFERRSPTSPGATLHLASTLRGYAAILQAVAAELDGRVHEDLGRFGAQVVERARHTPDPERAASEVADAFLALCSND
jgi:hypothetical protein